MDRNHFQDVPDALWAEVERLLPRQQRDPRGGRPRVPDRRLFAGIVFRLRTGCQWKALPPRFNSGSTCHRRFQEWVQAGVFTEVFKVMVEFYDEKRGIDWT